MAVTGTVSQHANQRLKIQELEIATGANSNILKGGAGSAGDVDRLRLNSGVLAFTNAQTIDMNDLQVVLTLLQGTPTGTLITSNVLYVDANSGATEDLLLPPEADCNGLMLFIANTGGEAIVVKDDGDSTTVGTLATSEVGYFFCDGTTWRGGVSTNT